MPRKRRNDRAYLIYKMTAPDGEFYIGLTARIGQKVKGTIVTRWKRHKSKAFTEDKEWTLHDKIREFPRLEDWTLECIDGLRGRLNAYARERELIAEHGATLNDF